MVTPSDKFPYPRVYNIYYYGGAFIAHCKHFHCMTNITPDKDPKLEESSIAKH